MNDTPMRIIQSPTSLLAQQVPDRIGETAFADFSSKSTVGAGAS